MKTGIPAIILICGAIVAHHNADVPPPIGDPLPPAGMVGVWTVYESDQTAYDGQTLSVNVDAISPNEPATLTLYVGDGGNWINTGQSFAVGGEEVNLTFTAAPVDPNPVDGRAYFFLVDARPERAAMDWSAGVTTRNPVTWVRPPSVADHPAAGGWLFGG